MTFTPKTVKYSTDEGTFHMLPGSPFRAQMVRDFVLDMGLATDRGIGAAFLIIEGYAYDFDPDGESDLASYFNERARSLAERFELFGIAIDTSRLDTIIDAYLATRDNINQEETPKSEPEKVAKKNGSKTSFGKPLPVNTVGENLSEPEPLTENK